MKTVPYLRCRRKVVEKNNRLKIHKYKLYKKKKNRNCHERCQILRHINLNNPHSHNYQHSRKQCFKTLYTSENVLFYNYIQVCSTK